MTLNYEKEKERARKYNIVIMRSTYAYYFNKMKVIWIIIE